MEKFTIHIHEDPSSMEIHNADGEPLGLVTLSENHLRWSASWIDVLEGGPFGAPDRWFWLDAVKDLMAAAAAGRVEIIVCS